MMSSEPQLGQRKNGGMLDIGDKDSTYPPILSVIYEKAPPKDGIRADQAHHSELNQEAA
jgi:hypothetical protein